MPDTHHCRINGVFHAQLCLLIVRPLAPVSSSFLRCSRLLGSCFTRRLSLYVCVCEESGDVELVDQTGGGNTLACSTQLNRSRGFDSHRWIREGHAVVSSSRPAWSLLRFHL